MVKVSFAGSCGSDQHILKKEFHLRNPVPFTAGHEIAGVIAEIGKDVKNF